MSTDEEPHYGKYGRKRRQYLKEHCPAVYSIYLLEDISSVNVIAFVDCRLFSNALISVS
ncbi:MAG: TnpV protein [Lachnospiraceae bacterium]|nr:TnpV protein [Lachnospiraceae bacterium]